VKEWTRRVLGKEVERLLRLPLASSESEIPGVLLSVSEGLGGVARGASSGAGVPVASGTAGWAAASGPACSGKSYETAVPLSADSA